MSSSLISNLLKHDASFCCFYICETLKCKIVYISYLHDLRKFENLRNASNYASSRSSVQRQRPRGPKWGRWGHNSNRRSSDVLIISICDVSQFGGRDLKLPDDRRWYLRGWLCDGPAYTKRWSSIYNGNCLLYSGYIKNWLCSINRSTFKYIW